MRLFSLYLTFFPVVRASLVYPTPAQTVRKAAKKPNAPVSSTKPALPALDINAAAPHPNAQAIVIGSNEDEDDEEESKSEEEKAAGNASNDETRIGGEGEDNEPELAVDVMAHIKIQAELDEYLAKVQAEYMKTGKLPSKKKKQAPALPEPVVSQLRPGRSLKTKAKEVSKVEEEAKKEEVVEVEEDNGKIELELSEMTDAQKNIVRHLVPQYDEIAGDPKFIIGRKLILLLGLTFKKSFNNGWQGFFYQVVRDLSSIKANKAFLPSVPVEEFRGALEAGGFATMQDAWRRNKDGRGEEARAERRGKALDEFELDRAHFGALVDPGNQSSEYSDPNDKALCIVQELACRTEKVADLLAAFDVGFKAVKKKTGNQQFTKFKFQVINVPVPKLKKTGLKCPEWGIDSARAK
ncbi:hypothetical protein FRC09_006490 [Ceratobasidium sp. 395]|nr:hypothetical protein FRC09_006490 [Ceratobasidium sp. 395]